jgi:hypothetical protein
MNIRIIESIGKEKFLVIGKEKLNKFELLALASKISYENKKDAWTLMRIASDMYHKENNSFFNQLYGDVAMEITRRNMVTEATICNAFNKNVTKLLGKNVRVIKRKNDNRHIPDSWILKDDLMIPVEVKLNSFDKKAKKQLLRYMEFYKCRKGIAVGKELTTEISENIQFIPRSQLEV